VTDDDRTVALTAVSTLVVYLVYCYGDLGLGTWTSVFTVAPALAFASRVAVTTGAWPSGARPFGEPARMAAQERRRSLEARIHEHDQEQIHGVENAHVEERLLEAPHRVPVTRGPNWNYDVRHENRDQDEFLHRRRPALQ
jgi:hypothetical protein